jgi:hypothetical protein
MATTAPPLDDSLVSGNDNHLEIFSLIWLDANAHAQEYQDAQEKLRSIINHLKIFHDEEECIKYIEQTPKHDRLVLIISGQLSRHMVPSIHQLRQISAIYVDSKDKASDEMWACEFTKVALF